jgi:hypothetical protein
VGDGCCRGRGEAACGCHYALNPTLVEGKGMARGAGAVGEERRSHSEEEGRLSYGPPWAHYLGGYQDRLLGGPLGLPALRYTAPEGVEHKDYTGVVLG